jgi:hypothetical protein
MAKETGKPANAAAAGTAGAGRRAGPEETGKPANAAAAGTAPRGKPPKSYRYRCKEPCTFMKRYRGVGDIVILPEKTDNPHFELIA